MMTNEDDVIVCVFRPCQECGEEILVLWNENPDLIETPKSCHKHQTH
jgi:hypothetical protein